MYKDTGIEAQNRQKRAANGGNRPPDGSYIKGGVLYKPAQNDDWY